MVEINTKQGKLKGFEIELKDEIGGRGSTDMRKVQTGGFWIPYLRWISDSVSKCAIWKTRTVSKTKTFWKMERHLGWNPADDWTAATSVQFRYVFINFSYLACYESSKGNLRIKRTD